MASEGAEMEYFPSISVIVPVVSPFICTETPGNGSPSDITVPEIRISCCTAAHKVADTTIARNVNTKRRLILIIFLWFRIELYVLLNRKLRKFVLERKQILEEY